MTELAIPRSGALTIMMPAIVRPGLLPNRIPARSGAQESDAMVLKDLAKQP
jgi:hypothetical protein